MIERRPPPQSEAELLVRAAALSGRSVGELARALGAPLPADARRAKGYVGTLVEAALGADPMAHDAPDFPALGVELKTLPLGRSGRPAESTFCCSIDMDAADHERWETSRLRRRLGCVLFVPVEAARLAPMAERRFYAPRLWRPSAAEEALLRDDYEELIGRVGAGAIVTAHAGRALQIRPKAASSRVRRLSAGEDGLRRALPLGFYLRTSFTLELISDGEGDRGSQRVS